MGTLVYRVVVGWYNIAWVCLGVLLGCEFCGGVA